MSLLLIVIKFAQGEQLKIQGYWLASGILGVTASTMIRVVESGADAVVTKSIGSEPRKGHPGPVLASSHGGLLNAVGLTNPGIEAFGDEMRVLREKKVPVVLSIFGNTIQEISEVARKGEAMKPHAIELNLSCPHAEISQIAHDPEMTRKYVAAVKDVVNCPVFAKLTPNAADIVAVGKAAEEAGADAVVAINTVRGMKIDVYQMRPVLGNKIPVTVRSVYELSQALSIPIVGVGGVATWQDAVELHLAGASAIQVGTVLIEGLEVFSQIKEGVKNYLKEMNISKTSEIVGAAWRNAN
ncbi:MAG: dihydroorotate dehydrogenase [Candidatus Thorarchaeota archaeon]